MYYANIDIFNAILYDAKFPLTPGQVEENSSVWISRLALFLGSTY